MKRNGPEVALDRMKSDLAEISQEARIKDRVK